jgi:hypothetical protein
VGHVPGDRLQGVQKGEVVSHYRRQVTRTDAAQPDIVKALRKAGYRVEIIGRPVDLAVMHPDYGPGMALLMEVKTPADKGATKPRKDKRQIEQEAFVAETGARRVWTEEMALSACKAVKGGLVIVEIGNTGG